MVVCECLESLPAGVWPPGMGVGWIGKPSEPQSLSLYNGLTFWKVCDSSWLERVHSGPMTEGGSMVSPLALDNKPRGATATGVPNVAQ